MLVVNPDPDLRARIERFDIDGGPAELTFASRLALENGWRRRYADRVVTEYKRFVYLAMVAGHPVTPSENVDEAWHLHLTYTGSYWDRMCAQVLPRPLHHNPTRGGGAEDSKFFDWYADTLNSYRAHFAEEPPNDIWPSPIRRFATTIERRKVNPKKYWIVRKPSIRIIGVPTTLLAIGCTAAVMDESGTNDREFFALLLGLAIVIFVVAAVRYLREFPLRNRKSRKRGSKDSGWWGGGCGGGGCGDAGGCASGGCGGGGCGGGCGS